MSYIIQSSATLIIRPKADLLIWPAFPCRILTDMPGIWPVFGQVEFVKSHNTLNIRPLPELVLRIWSDSGTPAENTWEVRKWQDYHSKIEFKSFPTVYDMPILLNIGLSYTVGKLLSSAFQWSGPHRGTQTCLCVLTSGVPEIYLLDHLWSENSLLQHFKLWVSSKLTRRRGQHALRPPWQSDHLTNLTSFCPSQKRSNYQGSTVPLIPSCAHKCSCWWNFIERSTSNDTMNIVLPDESSLNIWWCYPIESICWALDELLDGISGVYTAKEAALQWKLHTCNFDF